MTGLSWIQELREKVADANRRTTSSFAGLEDGRRQASAKIDEVIVRLGRASVARDRATDSELRARVLDALRRRSFDRLTVREQRYAAKLFMQVSAADMQHFLAAHPTNWNAFATECLRHWDAFQLSGERAAYTRLLCLAPSSVAFMHQVVRPQDLVSQDGPTMLARLINAADLRQACLELKKRGFDTTWSFTANTLASWIYLHCKSPYAFSGAWDAVKQDRTLEAMLLPPLAASATSWFSREPRPARVSPSVSAHATAVAALMRAAAATGVESPQWSAFAEGLLKSTFGDPRRPPESTGWRALRARDEPAYLWFLERLITEDITVFFEHAMNDRRRKAFWLRYLRSVRRTVCILNQVVHERLTVRLAGSDAKLAAAMSRALKFAGPNSGAQAFCLYFDTLVVVEFSDEGNAAYVYDRTVFEKHFERDIFSGQCRGHKDLKSVPLAGNRRIRHAGDWEHAAASDLASSRIHPDRR